MGCLPGISSEAWLPAHFALAIPTIVSGYGSCSKISACGRRVTFGKSKSQTVAWRDQTLILVYSLKFSFVSVGAAEDARHQERKDPKVNAKRAPILATVFTEVFTVYSAKKFPGVCESTPLSKTFATQGIKIPIRKDAKGGEGNDDDD